MRKRETGKSQTIDIYPKLTRHTHRAHARRTRNDWTHPPTSDMLIYNTIQYNTIQYNTIQYNTMQYNTIRYNTIQSNTTQPPDNSQIMPNRLQKYDPKLVAERQQSNTNTIQYNTIQYNTIRYITIQSNPIQYNTILIATARPPTSSQLPDNAKPVAEI